MSASLEVTVCLRSLYGTVHSNSIQIQNSFITMLVHLITKLFLKRKTGRGRGVHAW